MTLAGDNPGMMKKGLMCPDIIRLVTDYFENALDAMQRELFELHISQCDGCTGFLAQMRATITVTGRLSERDIPPGGRDVLLDAFRTWSVEPPSKPGLLGRLRQFFQR